MLTDSVEIKAASEKILDFLTHLDKNYTAWHPDHVACYWIEGESMKKGSVLCAEEYLHGKLHKMKFRISKSEPTVLEYDILFPVSLICPKGSFLIEPRGGTCLFTATLSFRPGMFSLFRGRAEALKIHMKEEGENLKTLLER